MLLRHGKSLHGFEYESDHARPLAPRGIKAAGRMGRLMKELGEVPDLVVSSTANRAISTAKLAVEQLPGVELVKTDMLYSVSTGNYYDVLHGLDDDVRSVVLVGHNFTIEEFADDLLERGSTVFKTCTLAVIRVGEISWREVSPGCGTLAGLYHPRELKD